MNAIELEVAYTQLANAIERVGPPQVETMLATLCLALMSTCASEPVLAAIEQAERLCKATS
jgi:replication-associated recombination protein RarA